MKNKPNILFIMTDQQHSNMMSCAGNESLKTPYLDALSSEGVRFTRAYCSNPVCTPSRISMATGMMPGRLGVDNNAGADSDKIDVPEILNNSMGRLMKKAGYETFHGGKAHLGKHLQPSLETGYDVIHPNDREELPKQCIDFMSKKRDKPFFAIASFINPHDVCFIHQAKNGINSEGILPLYEQAKKLPVESLPPLPDNYAIPEKEPFGLKSLTSSTAVTPSQIMRDEYDEVEWRIYRWIYHRLMEQVDALIGELLQGLKESGQYDDTLVLFTSDHGNMDASHRLSSKGFCYEESVGVPLLIKPPKGEGVIDREDSSLISTGLDILPTFCDYAGIEKPKHFMGKSLKPLSENKEREPFRNYVASENHGFKMIKTESYKYSIFSEGKEELLINTVQDPGEMVNLAGDKKYEEILSAHRNLCREWASISNDTQFTSFIN